MSGEKKDVLSTAKVVDLLLAISDTEPKHLSSAEYIGAIASHDARLREIALEALDGWRKSIGACYDPADCEHENCHRIAALRK